MQIQEKQINDSVFMIVLKGRMDLLGTQNIDLAFAEMTAAPRRFIIVDFSGVDFLASIGIRALLANAKAVKNRGGKLAILNPNQAIEQILTLAGIDTLTPIFHAQETALAAMNEPGE